MTMRPVIFISAVSKELKTARDHVAKALISLGYEPKWQDIAPTETGNLSGVLRKWVDESQAVIQLIGQCYGYEASQPDPQFGRCSYTQYEALYAKSRGKKVWYLPVGPGYTCDTYTQESEEFQQLQAAYLQRIRDQNDLRHGFQTSDQLEIIVLKLRDDLATLRAEWEAHREKMESGVAETKLNTELILQKLESLVKGGSEAKLIADYDSALTFIAAQEHLTVESLRHYLASRAERIVGDPHSSLQDKVKSLRDAGRFIEARDFALEAAARLESVRQKATRDEIEMLLEAAKSEIDLGHYQRALTHATQAESLADRDTDLPVWAEARHQLGRVLGYLRHDLEFLALYVELVPICTATFGAEHSITLRSRMNLATALSFQLKYHEAEAEHRTVLAIQERILGAEHRETLGTRMGLALDLCNQGEYNEAEAEHRAVQTIQKRVLGAEDPDTLMSRMNLANVLRSCGKYSEAEVEYRAIVAIQEHILGAEHPDALFSRLNLTNVLADRGKYSEAEAELRVLLRIHEGLFGSGHRYVLGIRNNLANALGSQGKYSEAEVEHRIVLAIQECVLGAEHPETLRSRNNLANAMRFCGKYSKAELEHKAVLTIQRRVMGAEHPETLTSQMNLANALNSQGKHAEAEAEHRAVLAIRERVLGAEHPDTLSSRNNLAAALDSQGKYAEAEAVYRAIQAIQECVLGAEHPDTLRSQYNLALTLEDQRRLPEALDLMQRSKAARENILGVDHPASKDAKAGVERIQQKIYAEEIR